MLSELYCMFVKTFGSAVYGVEAITITIEVNWTAQGKEYCIVGLPDSAIKESMQRIESSIKTNGLEMPRTRIVVNLAPADIRKGGTAFDLPIAIGILAASEQIQLSEKSRNYFIKSAKFFYLCFILYTKRRCSQIKPQYN